MFSIHLHSNEVKFKLRVAVKIFVITKNKRAQQTHLRPCNKVIRNVHTAHTYINAHTQFAYCACLTLRSFYRYACTRDYGDSSADWMSHDRSILNKHVRRPNNRICLYLRLVQSILILNLLDGAQLPVIKFRKRHNSQQLDLNPHSSCDGYSIYSLSILCIFPNWYVGECRLGKVTYDNWVWRFKITIAENFCRHNQNHLFRRLRRIEYHLFLKITTTNISTKTPACLHWL